MQPVIDLLSDRVAQAMSAATGEDICNALVKPSGNAKFGDYQANGIMALAKKLKTNPRELATKVVAELKLDDICETPEIAGPGFINLRLKTSFIVDRLLEVSSDANGRLAVDEVADKQNVVVDFSGPNIAKQMHVGHLRSTIIGDSIARMLEFLGHNVIRQNHVGDWGTQFGRVILGLWHLCMAEKHGNQYYRTELQELKDCQEDKDKLEKLCQCIHARHVKDWIEDSSTDSIKDRGDGEIHFHPYISNLENSNKEEIWSQFLAVYQYVNLLEESVTGMGLKIETRQYGMIDYETLSRYITVMLQNEDKQEYKAWEFVSGLTLNYCQKLYDRLSVSLTIDDVRGESSYRKSLAGIVKELSAAGLASKSDGAMCVFLDGYKNKEGDPLPFIIQKSDGAFLYATTDLAAMKYRLDELGAKRIIYVTDSRQNLHFQMLFETTKEAGWKKKNVKLEHVTFGSVLGENGKPLKTRSGENIKLSDLLDEAVTRAKAVVESKNPELEDKEKDEIANAVGIGAIKYADYSNNRESDYVFSFDKMLAMEGNTAPYMQYAFARIKSIERKAAEKGIDIEKDLKGLTELNLTDPAELDLAKHILRYSEAIEGAAAECRPNYLTSYLYELSQKFSTFYNDCPVLIAEADKRPTRLLLCKLTEKTIAHGLTNLLGIDVVEKM